RTLTRARLQSWIEKRIMPGDSVFPEIEEGFVSFHGIIRFSIHDCNRARVSVLVRAEARDQLVKLLQVGVMAGLFERINHDGANLARLCRPGGSRWRRAWAFFGARCIF